MAAIPVAGFPEAKFFKPPGKADDGKTSKGQLLVFTGLGDLTAALQTFALNAAGPAKKGFLTEIGLYGARETKLRTPVQYGVLRASIGHFTAEDLHGGSGDEAKAGAIFHVQVLPGGGSVTWGTNIAYAPWIEDGFTMATRRAVWFDDVGGFRMVNPFSYRGAHMFAAAAEETAKAVHPILSHWLSLAQKASEL